MKGQKAIGIFILGIIVIAYLVISNQPFLLSILTPSEYLSYNDLTAEEIEFLDPMLLELQVGHQEILIEGTIREGISGFYEDQNMKGMMCIGSLPISFLEDDGSGICLEPRMNNFLDRNGGNNVIEFEFMTPTTTFCSEITSDFCKDLGNCEFSWVRYPIYKGIFYYTVLPLDVTNCNYEKRFDGWYTIYDIQPSYDVFCISGESITYDFYKYTCTSDGKGITKEVVEEPITAILSAKEFIQYNMNPITYEVRMTGPRGEDVVPGMLGEYQFISSLDAGSIVSTNFEYLGGGVYRVYVTVSGVGKFNSKMRYTYLDVVFETEDIKIDVRPNVVAITADIVPMAMVGDVNEFKIYTFDSLGKAISVDNLYIDIYLPDGTTVDRIEFNDFKREGDGIYTFSYVFSDVEKYTFDIFGEKYGLVKGNTKASVAVGSTEEYGPGPIWISTLLQYLPYITTAFAIFGIMIWYFRIKK